MNFRRYRPQVLIATLLLAAQLSFSAHAAEAHYLKNGRPVVQEILAAPPSPNGAEQAADLAETIAVHNSCSPEDKKAALSELRVYFSTFMPVVDPAINLTNCPKANAFFERLQNEIHDATDAAKKYWKRDRPYTAMPGLTTEALEKSFSYPSGHSTRATVIALVLSEIFPDKKDSLITRSREIGWHRVQLGVHYPTDINAGRVFGLAIMRELKANKAFQRDLAEAKIELEAAHPAAVGK